MLVMRIPVVYGQANRLSETLVDADQPSSTELMLHLRAIRNSAHAGFHRAMRATEDFAVAFDAMSDDPAAAVVALGGQGVNCAFEAVERVRFARHHHFEALVVVISTNFALCH